MAYGSNVWIEVISSILLFGLVFGMSGTVDVQHLRAELKNVKAIGTGLILQFLVLPFLGFLVVSSFQFDYATGVTLLVVTSSPGGTYSNWWCSLFNADLALSVTMTAISTLVSTVMLPVNLLIYAHAAYNHSVLDSLEWKPLIRALLIVLAGIALGILASAKYNTDRFRLLANHIGSAAGVILLIFSIIMVNINKDFRIWNREGDFYVGVALPCVIGLILASITTSLLSLWKPERVAVSVETSYQNTGIATSVAVSMFTGSDRSRAIGVPVFYGMMEAIFLLIYCIGAWKAGWTKAPSDDNFLHMIFTTYEIMRDEDGNKKSAAVEPAEEEDYCYVDYNDAEGNTTEMVQNA